MPGIMNAGANSGDCRIATSHNCCHITLIRIKKFHQTILFNILSL